MEKKTRRLKPETISKLFSVNQFQIGDESIAIKPMALIQWIDLISKINSLTEKFTAAGLTLQNYNANENLLKLVTIAINDFPEVLENATGVDREDLTELPPNVLIALISAVIEINMQSKDELLKNSKRLTEAFQISGKTSSAE